MAVTPLSFGQRRMQPPPLRSALTDRIVDARIREQAR
jgi:hypothetical protein